MANYHGAMDRGTFNRISVRGSIAVFCLTTAALFQLPLWAEVALRIGALALLIQAWRIAVGAKRTTVSPETST